jgi:cytochrome c oxidase subunit 3
MTNTLVLITSSLTAALAVRAAHLGNNHEVISYWLATLALAVVFLAIKYVEYSAKFSECNKIPPPVFLHVNIPLARRRPCFDGTSTAFGF